MIAIRPRADQACHPGERITVERPEPDDLITIADEVTLPERVHLVEARRLTREEVITLTEDDARWLIGVPSVAKLTSASAREGAPRR